jgi:lipoate-protein ligase A
MVKESTVEAPWFLWVDQARPGWMNMAIDQALLDRADHSGESWLRLYTWKPHCLSFGRHEPASRRYDSDRIAAMGVEAVRRPTGGRAVWHSKELTYAVAAPSACFGSLHSAYLEIHSMLAAALAQMGVVASLAPRTRSIPLDAGACFSQPAGGEVMSGTQKVVGSAQFRLGRAFLQHGSILLQNEQHLVQGLTRQEPSVIAETFSIPFNNELSASAMIEAIIGVARGRWPGTWRVISKPDELLQAASRHYPQFRSPAWTWSR